MQFKNIKLIFTRELRDQLRDRRTLFTVAVMPMLLYPLMGMAMLQVSQFMQKHPSGVWMIGTDNLPDQPGLLANDETNSKTDSDAQESPVSSTDASASANQMAATRFHADLIPSGDEELLEIRAVDAGVTEFNELVKTYQELLQQENGQSLADGLIQSELQKRGVDVAVFFAEPISIPNLSEFRKTATSSENSVENSVGATAVPSVYIFHNSASDQSRIGAERVASLLGRWQSNLLTNVLSENDLPQSLLAGIQIQRADIAQQTGKQAAMWSKILPFIIVIWALTGAFYPAIDLCAGEKERGTFETLLSSPAARSEIAIGKLLTVMSFSAATSMLNLISMGFTGIFVVSKMGGSMGIGGLPVGMPPLGAFLWLSVALIPIAALFSAVALAAAAFARSSKEGQYYLVPLMMISMPLMMVPMLPGTQLNLGTSLIPISGLMLLLRGLIEGQAADCLRYVAPVAAVTFACCWFSVRWVIHQFNSETVLFRASERFSISGWVKHLMRERHELPTLAAALICGLVILVCKFFIGFVAHTPDSFLDFARQTVIILVATIGMPAVLMAMMLTRNPRKSLRLNSCTIPMACAAVLAAILLNPMFTWITALVMQVYPPGGNLMLLEQVIARILSDAPGLWAMLLVFAVAPAVIEEVAFRGFILSGLESLKSKWQAIIITSLLFGIAHSVIQQSMITFFVGMFIGVIAVQTRSIIPCILFHAVHNGLSVLLSQANGVLIESTWLSKILVTSDGQHYQYDLVAGIGMTVIGLSLMFWFLRLPKQTSQNRLSEKGRPPLLPSARSVTLET
jgi:sodium transport system permease protein